MNHALENRRIVNTRAVHQAGVFDEILRERGAVTLDYPCIEIVPVADATELDAALRDLTNGAYDWLVLTSANTVFALAPRLERKGWKLAGAHFRSAAIGPATAEAAHRLLGLEAMTLPEEFITESLGESLPVRAGERVLLPESAIARPTLANILRERGAAVTVVPAYRTVCGHGGADVPRFLAEHTIDAMTFTSTSTVTHFLERLTREGGRREDLKDVCAVCIGPKTAEAARAGGFGAVLVPSEYTLRGLVDALDRWFDHKPNPREDRP